ncbi:MAG: hypothetical protein IMY82_06070, partial [Chloroflexi bacterium]|nr:hypothetical protein [Chloroflexota bacterium]
MTDITPDKKPGMTPGSETEPKADTTADSVAHPEDEQKTDTADSVAHPEDEQKTDTADAPVDTQAGPQVEPKPDVKPSNIRWDSYFALLLV